jgi:glucokinase
VGDDCTAPNLPWRINARRLAGEIEIPRTTIINDFVAVGYGIEALGPADLATLQAGSPEPRGTIALIGPGTGLGQGFLFWERDHYRVLPSEGGHGDFAARGARQAGLLETTAAAPEQAAVRSEMEQEDPASVIVRHGLDGTDPLSVSALDLFCEILGAQAGNLALTVIATGGVYLAGGIAPRIVERLRDGPFMAAFREKGRLAELLGRIPVHVIMNPNVALLGAAAVAGRVSDGAREP